MFCNIESRQEPFYSASAGKSEKPWYKHIIWHPRGHAHTGQEEQCWASFAGVGGQAICESASEGQQNNGRQHNGPLGSTMEGITLMEKGLLR